MDSLWWSMVLARAVVAAPTVTWKTLHQRSLAPYRQCLTTHGPEIRLELKMYSSVKVLLHVTRSHVVDFEQKVGTQWHPSALVSARSTLVMHFDCLVGDEQPASAAVTSQLLIQACTQFTNWLETHAFTFFSTACDHCSGCNRSIC